MKVARILRDAGLAGGFFDAGLVDAFALEFQSHPGASEAQAYEFADGVSFVGSANIIVGVVLLEDGPHGVDVFRRIAPVAFGVEVSDD